MPARPFTRVLVGSALAVPVGVAAGCSGGDVNETVSVTVGADDCTLAKTTIQPGRTAFKVSNDSGKEAEAYVYTSGGAKVDEVEGIADGTSRTLTVSLKAGKYEFACKPEGSDHRASFTVG